MAKPRSGSKGVPRAEREEQILDAAAAEFALRGYAAATLADIGARAGISKPLIHSYFSSKQGLYCACCHRAGRELTERIAEALVDGDHSAMGRGAAVLNALFTALEPRPHDWNVLFDQTVPAGSEAADVAMEYRLRLFVQASEGIAASFADRLPEPGDLDALTRVWSAMVSALVDWWLHHPGESAAAMVARGERLLAALSE